jgi:dTDP-4-dehydrorhamnose reductase
VRAVRAHGHEAIGTFRTARVEPGAGLVPFDAGHRDHYKSLLDTHRPDIVVHAAGWTWVDGCEADPARAREENSSQPADLAAACSARGVRFVYISTSYVFDGTTPASQPYDESSPTGPDSALGVYALSKLEGERAVLSATAGQALVARVICVFGEDAARKNFACQVCDAMVAGKTMRLPSDQCGNPTWAGDIAHTLVDPECDRIEWANRLVAAFTRVGVVASSGFEIVGVPTAALGQKAPRPLHAGIVSARLATPTMISTLDDEVYRRIAQGAVKP